MEKGLLSTIQSWYVDDELCVDADAPQEKLRSRNSGRFIQLVLLELAKREPKTFEKIIRKKIMGLPPGAFIIQREYRFENSLSRSRSNRHRGQPSLTAPLPHHPACGSAPGGSRS
jgi:hypothetical protein